MHPQLGTFLVLGLVFAVSLSSTIIGIARDSDRWVILRGIVGGRVARIRRARRKRAVVRRG